MKAKHSYVKHNLYTLRNKHKRYRAINMVHNKTNYTIQ